MKKISALLEKYLVPVATKLGTNTIIQALQRSFMVMLPVILVGSFSLILSRPPVPADAFAEGSYWFKVMTTWTEVTVNYGQAFKFLTTITLGIISIYLCLGMAYYLSRSYELNTVISLFVSLSAFLLVSSNGVEGGISNEYFGGEGLFVGIVVTTITMMSYRFFVKRKIGEVKLPESVPKILVASLSALTPIAALMIGFATLVTVLKLGLDSSVPEIIMTALHPLLTVVNTLPGILFIAALGQLMFWFGIHNNSVLGVVYPVLYGNLAANQAAYEAGTAMSELPNILTMPFLWTFSTIGGGGATLALVLLLMRSKSEQLKAVGKLSIVPGFFGINEPVIFGAPIAFNPIYFIPFVFVPTVNSIITYICMSTGLVNKTIAYAGGVTPNILSQFVATLDYRAVLLFFVLVALDMLLWYPFVKLHEKQLTDPVVEVS